MGAVGIVVIWGKSGSEKVEKLGFGLKSKEKKNFFSLECKTLRLWVLALKWGQLGIFLPKPGKISKICPKKA